MLSLEERVEALEKEVAALKDEDSKQHELKLLSKKGDPLYNGVLRADQVSVLDSEEK